MLVLDGVDAPPWLRKVAASHPRFRLVPLPSPRGRGAARNAGVAAACGETIVFVDDDVLVAPCFLASHSRAQRMGPSLCRGPLRELPALLLREEGLSTAMHRTPSAGSRRLRSWCVRTRRDLRDPELCWRVHGRPSRIQVEGERALTRGAPALAWTAFAGANLSAPKNWLLEDPFDERPGTRWGIEDLALALRWTLAGRRLATAAGAWALHMSHRRAEWIAAQRGNEACLDFLPPGIAAQIVAYLEGSVGPEALESVLVRSLPSLACTSPH